MKYYTGDTSLEMLYAQAKSPDGVVPVTNQLDALLRSRHPSARAISGNESHVYFECGAGTSPWH